MLADDPREELRHDVHLLSCSLSGCKTNVAKSVKLRASESRVLEVLQSFSNILNIGHAATSLTSVTGHLEADRVVLLICDRNELTRATADQPGLGPALMRVPPQPASEAVKLLSCWEEEAVAP